MQPKRRILIVDDESDITALLKRAFEDHGFDSIVFNDPVQALAQFKANQYDMVLLDIRMPKMDGFELYDKIKQIDGAAKVCFMTAFEVYIDALREQFPKEEYDSICFIKKPFAIEDFVRKISREIKG